MKATFIINDDSLPPINEWAWERNFQEARSLINPVKEGMKRMGHIVSDTWTAKGHGACFEITHGKEKVGFHFYHQPNEEETAFEGCIRVYPTTTIPRIIFKLENKKREEALYASTFPAIFEVIESVETFSRVEWKETEEFDANITRNEPIKTE